MIAWLKICFSSLFLFCSAAQALDYLEFPAEKNNVQPLPQKFEYSLRDSSKLLLGNKIIETALFDFEIINTASSLDLNLRWPPNVVESGRITLLNPSRVAVWSQNVKGNQDEIRVSKASGLLQKLAGLSFFRFCIGHNEINTGIEVCSPELILKGSGNDLHAVARTAPGVAVIKINGRTVTPHGIVFLNDKKESLNFHALASSGAEFRMDTRLIDLEFTDVVDADEKNFILTVKGTPPLPPTQYKKIDNERWSVALPKVHPLFYVPGEGKVPLRQEFIVQGPLPTRAHRLQLNQNAPKRTYSSSLEMEGQLAEKGTPQSADGSHVDISGRKFAWHLNNIPMGRDKRNYLQTVDDGQIFTAAYIVSRLDSMRLEALAGLNTDDMRFYAGVEGQKWFEDLLFQQRLGAGFIYNTDVTGDAKLSLLEFDLLFRLTPGLQFSEPTWIAGLAMQNWSFDSESLSTFSPIIGWQGPATFAKDFFYWQEAEFRYSMPTKKSGFEIKSLMQARWKLYQLLRTKQKFRYSAGVYSQDVGNSQTAGALLEVAWIFTF